MGELVTGHFKSWDNSSEAPSIENETSSASFGGGGGTGGGGPMDPIIEERIKRSEAETRIELTKLDGKIELVLQKLDAVSSDIGATKAEVTNNKWQLAVLGVALVALLIGVWAYSTQMSELTIAAVSMEETSDAKITPQSN